MSILSRILITLFLSTELWAQADSKLQGIAVVSDFHLFDATHEFQDDFERSMAQQNEKTYRQMLGSLKKQNGLSHIIMNGDIFHAPSMKNVSPELRIEKMVSALFEMNRETGKPIHFNFGNHDILMEMVDGQFHSVPGFAQKFEEVLNQKIEEEFESTGKRPQVHLIGAGETRLGDYKAVYELKLGGKDIRISHAPFVSTETIAAQAESFKEFNPRAYDKVVSAPRLTENPSGIIYIQSDSHTPGYDHKLKVYNTGMLTVDKWVPFKDSTFVVLGSEGGSHYMLDRQAGPLLKFELPNCGMFFNKR